GGVKDLSVTGATGDEEAQKCVQRGLSSLSFPTPAKPTKVTLSIVRATGRFFGTAGFTLTRLHMRYAKDALGDDLVFREAPPIVGGREFMQESGDGGARLEERSRPASTNNFQSRYAIRHPWPGAINCANPVRGRWGSPWPDAGTPSASPQAATKTAFAQRGNVQLASYVDPKLVPELELAGYVPPTPSAAPSAPAPSASASAKGSGCGSCSTGGGGNDTPLTLGGAGFVLLAVLRRYHRRRET
ncbi:MAG TPA: MYXO-CTERM sorting domain-containing protein, partial [Polyangiaceae bacterium]